MKSLHLLIPGSTLDFVIALCLFLGLIAFLALSELAHKYLRLKEEIIRKSIHIFTGIFIVLAGSVLSHPFPIIVVAVFFAVFNYISIRTGIIKGLSSRKNTLGTVYYPLAVIFLILTCWENNKPVFIISVLILAIADAAAAIVGEHWRKPHLFRIWHDRKSFEGSFAMFFTTFFILYLGISYYYVFKGNLQPDLPVWIISLFSALIITISEMIASKGSDNVNVAVISALSLKLFLYDTYTIQEQFIWGFFYGAAAAGMSYYFRFLDKSGSVTAFALAVIIYGVGGWSWTVPMLVFFILSSILSKIGKRKKASLNTVFEKGNIRDAQQVLANGGLATIWAVVYYFLQDAMVYYIYLATLAAAAADTWGTEIGIYSNRVRLITNFNVVEKGRSGGISVIGTFGAYSGSFLIALSGFPFLKLYFINHKVYNLLFIVTLAGFIGSIVDSFLGALVQGQYLCNICGKITEKLEHCGSRTGLQAGYPWINNDMVNFLATLSSSLIVLFLLV